MLRDKSTVVKSFCRSLFPVVLNWELIFLPLLAGCKANTGNRTRTALGQPWGSPGLQAQLHPGSNQQRSSLQVLASSSDLLALINGFWAAASLETGSFSRWDTLCVCWCVRAHVWAHMLVIKFHPFWRKTFAGEYVCFPCAGSPTAS